MKDWCIFRHLEISWERYNKMHCLRSASLFLCELSGYFTLWHKRRALRSFQTQIMKKKVCFFIRSDGSLINTGHDISISAFLSSSCPPPSPISLSPSSVFPLYFLLHYYFFLIFLCLFIISIFLRLTFFSCFPSTPTFYSFYSSSPFLFFPFVLLFLSFPLRLFRGPDLQNCAFSVWKGYGPAHISLSPVFAAMGLAPIVAQHWYLGSNLCKNDLRPLLEDIVTEIAWVPISVRIT
jgi:hypothetical protein